MTMSNVSSINDTVQKTQVWLKELEVRGLWAPKPGGDGAAASRPS